MCVHSNHNHRGSLRFSPGDHPILWRLLSEVRRSYGRRALGRAGTGAGVWGPEGCRTVHEMGDPINLTTGGFVFCLGVRFGSFHRGEGYQGFLHSSRGDQVFVASTWSFEKVPRRTETSRDSVPGVVHSARTTRGTPFCSACLAWKHQIWWATGS